MSIKRFLFFFCLVSTLFFYPSCSSNSETKYTPVLDTIGAIHRDSDGDGVKDDVDLCPDVPGPVLLSGCPGNETISRPDSSAIPSPADAANATVSYSFFKKIKQHETKDIRVLLKINTSHQLAERILNEREDIEQQVKSVSKNDTNEIRSLSMKGYKLITVALEYDTADFVITSVNTDEKQGLDTLNGNYWHWRVKAITDKKRSEIVIKVKAEQPGGAISKKDSRTISVDIAIDNIGGLRRLWNWVLNNPQYSIPSLIVPFLLYLFGRRRKNTN